MQLQFLEGSPKTGTSGSLWDLSGGLSLFLHCRGGGHAAEQGFPAAPSEGQGMTAALCCGWLQGCEARSAARGAEGCPSEQGPCTPGGCVPGQGLCHLPGSALSLPGELPMTPWGEAVGGRSHSLQGRVLVSRECSVGQGCSQLQIPTGHSPETFQEAQQGRGYLKGKDPVLSIFYSGMSGWAM